MLKNTILSSLLVFSLFLQACSKEKKESNNESLTASNIAKANSVMSKNEYVLTGLDGKLYTVTKELNGYSVAGTKGKVVIFDIFATWCPPCRATAPHLNSLQKKYKDDLLVIGVTIESDLPNDKLKEFRNQYEAQYALVNSDQNRRLVNSITSSLNLGEQYPIPIMVLYKDGEIIKHYVGLVEEEFVESDIKLALGK